MESQVLVVGGGHGASAVAQQQQQHYGSRFPGGMKRFSGVCPVPSSPGKQQQQQWQFRVEKRVELRPPKKTSAVEVRAKKSGLDFKLPGSLKLKKGDEPEDAKGTQKFGTAKLPGTKKLPGTLKLPGSQRIRRKDSNVVFVAGATGKVGRRVVRELVQLGYKVRAGVRDVEKAEFLVEFAAGVDKSVEEEEGAEEPEEKPKAKGPNVWASFAPGNLFGFLGSAKKSRVDLVEFDLGVVETIEDAIGNAGVVVCAIGASEKEALNALAPYRIDFKATENLINAASDAKVKHFVLVTSLGTQKIGWPAAALNLFWGVLIWKAKAEKALISSGIPFTIVRPGGMERPTDAYKETHNLILDKADSRFGGQVSNLQVAELIAGIVSNLKLSQNKVLEVVAETTAPLRPIEDLLAEIPSIDDIEAEKESSTQKIAAQKEAEEEEKLAKRKEAEATKQREEEEKFAKNEALKAAKQKEEEERLAAQERAAEEQAKTEALRQKLQKEYSQAKAQEDEAKKSAQAARLQKEDIEKRVAELRSRAEAAAQAAKEAKAVEAAVLAAVREKKTLSDREKKDIVAKLRAEEQAAAKEKAAKEKAAKEAEAKAIREAETKALREKEAARIEAEKKRRAEEAKIVAQVEQAARAEAEAKANTEADRKAKAEADKKAKADAEVKATKAKVEAEEKAKAKAKAEAEAKAKAEEERLKKEEEEKLKAAAEAKVKEEKVKAEAEAKAKAEEEEKVKAAAEAKAKAEDEEKLKAEADARAKEEAEAEAAAEQEKSKEVQVIASGDVFAEKKETPKPFRWPWQKEPETQETVSEPEIQDAAAAVDIEQKVEDVAEVVVDVVKSGADKAEEALIASTPEAEEAAKAAAEELKRLAAEAAAEAKKREEATLEKAKAIAAEAKKREEAALEKAKATTATFFWPWQKPKTDNTSSARTKQAIVSSSSTDLPRANRPLSPYTRYPGLRPLASPTPSPPVVSKAQSVTDGFASSQG